MRRPWFAKNRKGQALMEYVLLIALVATCLVAILGLTRKAANDAYARTSVKLGPMGGSSGFGSSGSSWHPSADGAPTPSPADSAGGDPSDSAGAGSASSAGMH
jgi:Flp pilus assembly pilin Flp